MFDLALVQTDLYPWRPRDEVLDEIAGLAFFSDTLGEKCMPLVYK